MKPNSNEFVSPHFNFLSDNQLDELHLKTLEVLERVGVRIDEEEALGLLEKAGAYREGNRVRFPSWLIDDAIRSAPQRIVLSDREGKRTLYLEKNQPYFGTGSDLPYTYDHLTGERRKSRKQDVVNAAIVAENLENIDFIMSMAIAGDKPEEISDLHQFAAMAINSKKPIVFTTHNRKNLLRIIEMAAIIRGSEKKLMQNPYMACYSEPISPLYHTKEGTQKLLTCAQHKIPVMYTPGLMGGAVAPVTLAGALVVANSELLSGLVIHQLKQKGAPFIYGGCASFMDMKTMIQTYAKPEFHMNSLVLTQLSQKYKLPMFSTAGCTDSPTLDLQAGLEDMYSLLLAGLSGANLIHDVGYVNNGLTQSLTSMAINNEAISMVKRLLKGYEINDNTVPIDVIEEIGPCGEYLSHEHTYKNFSTHWDPELLCRKNYDNWQKDGAKTMYERAHDKVVEILNSENISKLDKIKRDKINAILENI
ncbi:MAG TPA: trimethylamine methyltransferase family protein [Halanaerobiales bacterium]|nr:trimethylamine methyltransferase family protein [Halanaerobiales bacterium]